MFRLLILIGFVSSSFLLAWSEDSLSSDAAAKARQLFEKEKYAAALKAFSRLEVREADRAELDRWLEACRGGKKLKKVRKLLKKKKWQKAQSEHRELVAEYGDTPLGAHLAKIAELIELARRYEVATFERNPPKPESSLYPLPPHLEVVDDPELVKSGKRALRWNVAKGLGKSRIQKPGALYVRLGQVDPQEVGRCSELRLSIHSKGENAVVLVLSPDARSGISNGDGAFAGPCMHSAVVKLKEGWNDVAVTLNDLESAGSVKANQLDTLGLTIVPHGSSFRILGSLCIDDVYFMRR